MSTSPPVVSSKPKFLPGKSWQHFIAGGIGGMCGAVVTSPFDVVKTRLQSTLFLEKPVTVRIVGSSGGATVVRSTAGGAGGLLWNFVETGYILRTIYREESPRALFKGLGPTLVGTIPAKSINFFTYANGKRIIANTFNNGQENTYVHLASAALAGIVTGTVTNPIWVLKTRLQLASTVRNTDATPYRTRGAGLAMIRKIFREEGVRGFYKGLTASYVGVSEGTIQWVLYEKLKRLSASPEARRQGGTEAWLSMLASAGTAKCIATIITYPHEVIRTRLREPRTNGIVKYTGFMQTFRLILAEEGARAFYNGLSAHLMRVVPNAAVVFSIYEGIMRWGTA
ncbi:mitochondrial carrier [Marasmius fiardii PR-910]|nr:mitochondrial carrier [Marasmius fiardii PR-910]